MNEPSNPKMTRDGYRVKKSRKPFIILHPYVILSVQRENAYPKIQYKYSTVIGHHVAERFVSSTLRVTNKFEPSTVIQPTNEPTYGSTVNRHRGGLIEPPPGVTVTDMTVEST